MPDVTEPQRLHSSAASALTMARRHWWRRGVLGVSVLWCLCGCQSLVSESASVVAGLGAASLAEKVTNNAAVTAGIGIGAQAATRSAMQYALRQSHGATQQTIALAAAPLNEGEVATWSSVHAVPLEADEQGRVTVSRTISAGLMHCKEIVYSVDTPAQPAVVQQNTHDRPVGLVSPPDDLEAWLTHHTTTQQSQGAHAVAFSHFYVAAICQAQNGWVWATAEPAVSRWGALQ